MSSENREEGFRWVDVELSDIFYLVRKHIRALILIPVACFVLAVAIAFSMQPVFEARAEVFVRPNFDKEIQIERTFSKLEDEDSLRSIERALVSDTVILAMVNRLDLRRDPSFLGEAPGLEPMSDAELLKEIRKRYSAELIPNTRLVELVVEDYSAERTVVIANTLIDEFLKHLRADRNRKEADLRDTLISQSEKALARALESEKSLKQFRSENPDTLVEQDSSIFQERLSQYSAALNEANSEKSRLAGMVKVIESIDPGTDPFRVFQVLSNRNSEYLSDLLTMHAGSKADLAEKARKFSKTHPSYISALGRLDEVELSLRQYAAEMKKAVGSEFEAANRKVQELAETLASLQSEFAAFKSAGAEFRGIKGEIDRNWNTYTSLQQKIMDLDLDPEVTPTFATVTSEPIVPYKKSSPSGLIWGLVGIVLGGMLSAGWVYRRNRYGLPFTSASQPGRMLDHTVVARLQVGEEASEDPFLEDPEACSEMSNLLHSTADSGILHVTTLGKKDDRIVSEALARAVAAQVERALLISVNHRVERPTSIRQAEVANLSTLELPANILLNPELFRKGIATVSASFDRVLVDTTELIEADAKISVAQEARQNVLLVDCGSGVPRSDYREFLKRCAASGVGSIKLACVEGDTLGAEACEDETAAAGSQPEAPNARPGEVRDLMGVALTEEMAQ